MRDLPFSLMALLSLCALSACGEDKPDTAETVEGDTDTDTDADTDTDTDTDTDADTDTQPSCDVELVENGDEEADVTELGSVAAPFLICGDLYASSNDGTSYTGDMDRVGFSVKEEGTWTFVLTWAEVSHDLDVHLMTGDGVPLDAAFTVGVEQPEQFEYALEAGGSYVLIVVGWSGNGETRWELQLQ
jgi:hypothetical protein